MTRALTLQDLRRPRPAINRAAVAGFALVALFVMAGVVWSSYAPITKGATASGALISDSKTKPVQHLKGGRVATVHVKDGAEVREGEPLVTLDASEIVQSVAAVEGQLKVARQELVILKQEHGIVADLVERQLSPRPKLSDIERQIAQLDKEIIVNETKLGLLRDDARDTQIRAPVSGRVLTLAVNGPGAVVQPGGLVAEIVPSHDNLVTEGRLAANDIDGIHPGMPAKIWLLALNRRDSAALTGKLAWVSADSIADKYTGQPYYQIRIVLDSDRDESGRTLQLYPGMRTEILVIKGETTLLDALLDPLLRNVQRAFRSH